MTNHKNRWTPEEEEALRTGVIKYGQGKWKLILSDPQLGPSLTKRSNIDLKDKWRNMNVTGIGSSSRDEGRTLGVEGVQEPSSVVLFLEHGGTAEHSESYVDPRTKPNYEAMIFDALSSVEVPNGLDINAIQNIIEERFEVPKNFKRLVTAQLRRLVLAEKLEKVVDRYNYTGASFGAETSREVVAIPNNIDNNVTENAPESSTKPAVEQTPVEAAMVAARKIAIAENLEQEAIKVCKEADKLAELLEASEWMLKIAKDLQEKCSKKGMVKLKC